MVIALISGSSSLGSTPGCGYCIISSAVPLSTQVYKWVPTNILMLGGGGGGGGGEQTHLLSPPGGVEKYLSFFFLKKKNSK